MLFDRDSKGDRFSRRHFDSNGNRSGYSRPNLLGGYVNYDRKGRRVGRSEENADGSFDHYDGWGNKIGSSGEEGYMDCYTGNASEEDYEDSGEW